MATLPDESYLENERLANKYRPLRVLYPEIADNSKRVDHYHPGHAPGGSPPLDQAYHPRDIRLILDNARLPATGIYKCWQYLRIRRKNHHGNSYWMR